MNIWCEMCHLKAESGGRQTGLSPRPVPILCLIHNQSYLISTTKKAFYQNALRGTQPIRFHLSQSHFGQTTSLSLDRSFQVCVSIYKKECPEGVVFLFLFLFFFFQFFKKEGFETERIGCVYQVLFQCLHMETGTILQPAADNWTVRPGTNGLRGCIYHITFSLSVLSTDT